MAEPVRTESASPDLDADPVIACIRAALDVRHGEWMRGAPSHVMAEFLTALKRRGWKVTKEEGFAPTLVLMDAGVTTAARLSADVRIAGRRQDFDLPIWRDNSGTLRIGLPKLTPELLAAVGEALQRNV